MKRAALGTFVATTTVGVFLTTSAHGQGSETELANAVQNPVSNLISVPFQNNLDYDIGAFDRAGNTLNIQPVVPVPISEQWSLITRTIIPIVYQPDTLEPSGGDTGLGDINPTVFLSPAEPGTLIWGAGITAILPTATQRSTGSGRWSLGPAAVLLVQPAPWTIGLLGNQVWSFAGQDDRPDVSHFLLQYFVNYNLPRGWYLTSSPIITANWEAPDGSEWLVPFGGGIGKVAKVYGQALNGQLSAYVNAVTPDDLPSPSWQLRIQLAFLFPK